VSVSFLHIHCVPRALTFIVCPESNFDCIERDLFGHLLIYGHSDFV
jgi:hypothetical protein